MKPSSGERSNLGREIQGFEHEIKKLEDKLDRTTWMFYKETCKEFYFHKVDMKKKLAAQNDELESLRAKVEKSAASVPHDGSAAAKLIKDESPTSENEVAEKERNDGSMPADENANDNKSPNIALAVAHDKIDVSSIHKMFSQYLREHGARIAVKEESVFVRKENIFGTDTEEKDSSYQVRGESAGENKSSKTFNGPSSVKRGAAQINNGDGKRLKATNSTKAFSLEQERMLKDACIFAYPLWWTAVPGSTVIFSTSTSAL